MGMWLTPLNIVKQEVLPEGNVGLAALLGLEKNARQVARHRRDAGQEVSHMAASVEQEVLPAVIAGLAVCRQREKIRKNRSAQMISWNVSFFWKCRSYSGMLLHKS